MDTKSDSEEFILSNANIFQSDRLRNVLALLLCVVIIVAVLVSQVQGVLRAKSIYEHEESYFRLFTTLSNIFALLCNLVMLSYAIDGLRKKRFKLPKWVVLVYFSGTLCLFITMLVTLIFILPVRGTVAVTGVLFWQHIFIPVCTLLMFVFTCNERMLKLNEMILTTIPYFIYSILYGVLVKLVGAENGGWYDEYQLFSRFNWYVVVLFCALVGFLTAGILLLIHNVSTQIRYKNLINCINKSLEGKDKESIETEVFEHGISQQFRSDRFDITIPIDELKLISEKSDDYSLEQLAEIYVKGAMKEFIEGKDREQ